MPVKKKLRQVFGVLLFQGLAFIITFATNIIIIRSLPKSDYAIFTICFQMLGVVTMLSDSGITPAFRRMSGLFWESKKLYSSLVVSKFELRNQVMVTIIPISLAIAGVLFYRQAGLQWNLALWIVLLAFLVYFEVLRGMYMEVLRTQLQVAKVQIIENLLNILRLIFGLVAIVFHYVEPLLFAYILASLLTSYYARVQSFKFFDAKAASKKSYKKLMSYKYKELLPNSLFSIIQSQIILFLLTFFHRANGVADFGAIARITVIFNMLNSVILNLFAANFSRNQNIASLRTSYFKLVGVFTLISFGFLFGIYLFRHPVILLLGKKYYGLELLLVQLTFNSCITFLFGSINMLNNAKAWVFYNARFAIPVSIVTMVLGIIFLDLSNIRNIVLFSLLPIVTTGLLKIADSLRGLKLIPVYR